MENQEVEQINANDIEIGDESLGSLAIEPEEVTIQEPEEVVVSIGDEEPEEPPQETPVFRELRKSYREQAKEIKELRAKLQQVTAKAPEPLGAKPKLEDFDYDAEKFEESLSAWFEKKRAADAEAEKAKQAEQQQQQEWQNTLGKYQKARESLRVRDFDEVEASIQEKFNVTQQGVLLQGAEDPALLVYAIGKNPKKADELSAIKDPVKFAFAVAKLETQLKVTPRKPATPPEKALQSVGRTSGAIDTTLERLREEAAKTGDMSKVIAYKRQKRA